ncbi:MAG: YceD family protein [Aestuariivirga sp.]
MTAATPEFSRLIAVDRVPRGGSHEKIAADPKECQALALRLAVPALHALSAELRATPWRGGLKLEGTLHADLEQVSVVSLETFRDEVEFPVLRYFMPAAAITADSEAAIDPIEDGQVDLGEVVTETLILELDPYPRRPGEAFDESVWAASPSEAEPSPFAGLARLKPKSD